MATSFESEQMLDNNPICDTHAHLSFRHFDSDRHSILRSIERGVLAFVIEVGIDLSNSRSCIKLADSEDHVYATVGIHPHDSAKVATGDYLETMKALVSSSKKVVAIGETGLDYYRDLSPRKVQKRVFVDQLNLASKMKLPVVVHIREAYDDALEILRAEATDVKVVVHSFSGDRECAKEIIKLGFYLGIGCPITYRRNDELRKVVAGTPLDRILPETDSPFLPPQELRGKRNDPRNVRYVFSTISDLKGASLEGCSDRLLENATSFFGIRLREA